MQKYLIKAVFDLRDEVGRQKKYDFISFEDCKVNDVLVVDTKIGIRLVRVCEIIPLSDENYENVREDLKEVIDVVDFSAFEARAAYREEREAIKRKMDARVVQLQKDSLYELFAEKDETMRDLLAQYRDLDWF